MQQEDVRAVDVYEADTVGSAEKATDLLRSGSSAFRVGGELGLPSAEVQKATRSR